jgi:DNA mismatch repair protein MutS
MMQQYEQAKQACPEALLLFRMGDFYELFHDDAKTAARILNLTLTSREKGENAVPMAGFPYHQLDAYLAKLIQAGVRVAICEQVEDPKQAQGLVKREVTRIVSPGTVTDDALLDPREPNYLAALLVAREVGLAWVDLSTGRFWAARVDAARLDDELARIAPKECLIAEEDDWPFCGPPSFVVTKRPNWAFGLATSRERLLKHFGVASLEGFGFGDDDGLALRSAGAILDYLTETQKSGLGHINQLLPYRPGSTLEIDQATRRSLEISRTLREERREGSLLGVLDRCVTAMGSRLLVDWLVNPLMDRAALDERLDAVEELIAQPALVDSLREELKRVYDVERLISRTIAGRATPRDVAFLGRTLRQLPSIKARLTARSSGLLNRLEAQLDLCPEVRAKLDAALVDDCPLASREGGIIREGYHPQLDALRELAAGGKQWIAEYQAAEIARTGISSLKVGFNKVFGYYIEVTHAHGDKIPADYIRKQTIKNAERYVTPQLKEYEERVLTADSQTKDLEHDLFVAVRDFVAAAGDRLQRTAQVLAHLDVLCGLADLARARGYCRPRLVDEPVLSIEEGRHPVLDILAPAGTFVPNDIEAGAEHDTILLVTGPNMAGKSTFIRQVALLTLMAQVGSFVPAKRATIGIADRIFARVGASDELAKGQSTFMVEMTETARILNNATERSLVILDEIGRGTSTYDGVSLAWAVVEYIHDRIGCRTLFATHYHELADLERTRGGVKNVNVAVREWQEEVVFLHKIVPGAADKSYGIQVARLAGVPRAVVERAKEILAELENQHLDSQGRPKIARQTGGRSGAAQLQLTLFAPVDHPLIDKLRELDINDLTPMAALKLLEAWQAEVRVERSNGRTPTVHAPAD